MNKVDLSLYGILDPERTDGRDLAELAAASVAGGVTLLQYRDKLADAADQIRNAKAILSATSESDVPLLINDHPQIAIEARAHGVHLGQSDMHPEAARQLLGDDAIIGLTVKTHEDARSLPIGKIDYACIGGVFDTASKDNPVSIGVDGWRELADIVRSEAPGLPIGAIAGITAENLERLIETGADGVAIISAIYMAPDVREAASSLSTLIAKARNAQ
ncbi:MAG: thiamine phosphate synthase [Pseudomonadota bacterium]